MTSWQTRSELRLRLGLLGLVLLGIACRYRFAGPGTLPQDVKCISISTIANLSQESQLEAELVRRLENEVARRGFACGSGEKSAMLSGVIDRLQLAPATLRDPDNGGVASDQISVELRVWLDLSGQRVWESGPILYLSEVAGVLSDMAGADPPAAAPGTLGLSRAGVVRRSWTRMSSEIAERVFQQLTSDM